MAIRNSADKTPGPPRKRCLFGFIPSNSSLPRVNFRQMDGNFADTFDIRVPRADTLIFLDLPRWVCLRSVFIRLACNLGRARPDMAPGCKKKIDWEFIRWIWTFRSNTRPAVLQTLERCRAEGRNVHHFLSRPQVSRFLRSAAARGASTEEFP